MFAKKYLYGMGLIVIIAYLVWHFILKVNSPEQHPSTIVNVQLNWQNNEIDCRHTFSPSHQENTWYLEQLQFFISDIEVADKDKVWQTVALKAGKYQTKNVALVGENCRANKNLDTSSENWQISFDETAVLPPIHWLRFKLGVPFAQNHLNPISQQSPLNLPTMFWVWQTGHKFVRLELASKDSQWLFHLGSTGCVSSSVMRAPKQDCQFPNLYTYEMPVLNASDGSNNHLMTLDVQLDALLSGIDIATQKSCQSEREEQSCRQLFANLARSHENTAQIFKIRAIQKVEAHDIE